MTSRFNPEILEHYDLGMEQDRLEEGRSRLERVRTQELLSRHLPPAPAVVLDVGGAAGVHALWLAKQGYEVHLVDPVPLHVEQATKASLDQEEHPLASAALGDARKLERSDASVDAVLLLGPLYHLTDRADRLLALGEAKRVLRPGGALFAVGITRFTSLFDGLSAGYLEDPEFARIVEQDLRDGQHRNPSNHPGYFTTAFFHHPDELRVEVQEAGFDVDEVISIEGPVWWMVRSEFDEKWEDPGWRERLLDASRAVERDPTLLGLGPHIMVIARNG
jgi:ubiquinone/menaquinone biosynthesis C-methylase UbiE